MERSEGKPCPHCGAIDSEAIISLDDAEPITAPPATAITAKLPAETADKVTCPRCGKRFDASDDPEIPWLSCPFCHKVNPEALVRRTGARPKGDGALGFSLVILGVLAISAGTILVIIGMSLRHLDRPAEFIDIAVTIIWVVASVAVITVGIFLISSNGSRAIQRNFWGPGAFFLILMLLGFAGWIFAFSTCVFLPQ
jgi:hypothetical protein